MNLLQETVKVLNRNDKSLEDIVWIGTLEYEIDKNEFLKLADVEYDSGYGAPEVATDLIIVGRNWTMKRWEYDGSEGWDFDKAIIKPSVKKSINCLTVNQSNAYYDSNRCGWEELTDLNQPDE